jgi:hypothetical protein
VNLLFDALLLARFLCLLTTRPTVSVLMPEF